MGGGTPATKDTKSASTSNKTPYGPAAQYFPALYEQGANLAFSPPTDYVAGPSEGQKSSVNQLYNLAPTAGSAGSPMVEMAKRIASGEFMDPSQNPAFAGAANAAIAPITKQFTERVLPGLTNTAIQAGGAGTGPSAFGGASLGVPQMGAVDDWTRATGDVTSKMALDYSKLGSQLLGLAPELSKEGEAQRLMPATITGAAGGQEQSWVQNAINNVLQKYSTSQSALTNFTNLLTAGNYGTQQQDATSHETSMAQQPSMLAQILQGAAGAAGIAGSMFGAPAGGTAAASTLMNLFRSGGGGPSFAQTQGNANTWIPAPYM